MSAFSLTPKQVELKAIIAEEIETTGSAPTFEEMRVKLGLTSKSSVARLILALEQRGHIRRLPNKWRAIEVLTPKVAS